VAGNSGNDVPRVVLDRSYKRLPVKQPGGLRIELVDALREEAVEIRVPLIAQFNTGWVHCSAPNETKLRGLRPRTLAKWKARIGASG
jgi:hypothetical protein